MSMGRREGGEIRTRCGCQLVRCSACRWREDRTCCYTLSTGTSHRARTTHLLYPDTAVSAPPLWEQEDSEYSPPVQLSAPVHYITNSGATYVLRGSVNLYISQSTGGRGGTYILQRKHKPLSAVAGSREQARGGVRTIFLSAAAARERKRQKARIADFMVTGDK